MRLFKLFLWFFAVHPFLIACSTGKDQQKTKDEIVVLIEAAGEGKKEVVNNLLQSKSLLERVKQLESKIDFSPLHAAAAKGQLETLRLLLDSGLPVDFKDSRGQTPLHYAVAENTPEIIKLLLERKANPNAKSSSTSFENSRISTGLSEMSPFTLAASIGDLQTLTMLLDNGASIDGGGTATPLYFAAASGHEDAVKFLLKRGAKVKTSVTFEAVQDKHPKTANILRNHFCRYEMPQPVGIASIDQSSYQLRKMMGCPR